MKLETIIESSKTNISKGQIVLIHGACMGAWCWSDNFLPWFTADGYDVHAISLRNHAGSEKKGSLRFKSVKEYVEDLRQVIQTLPGPVFLIGHSMGGFTIQHYLTDPDPRVQKAVLLCSSPPQGNMGIIPRLLKDLPIPFLKANLQLSWKPVFKENAHARKVMFSEEYPEIKLEKAVGQMQDESFLAFLEMTALNLPDYKKVKTPLMIIGGEKDYLIPEKATRKMADLYKTEAYIVKNAPHNIMMESGWENVAEKISTFLAP
jgi:pimeloyl-ACP methyl ester carboxylesterase